MLYEIQNTNANMHVYHNIQFWSILAENLNTDITITIQSQRMSLPVLI